MTDERCGPDWIAVAVVTGPHGVRGEVRVHPLTDFPERLFDLEEVALRQGESRRRARITSVRPHARGKFLVKIEGIDDRDRASEVKGAKIEVSRDEVVPLPEGRYYVFELVGCRVETVEGKPLGELVDVITTTANDVYVVRDSKGREVLVPAIRDVVRSIDPKAGRVVVDLLPGLV